MTFTIQCVQTQQPAEDLQNSFQEAFSAYFVHGQLMPEAALLAFASFTTSNSCSCRNLFIGDLCGLQESAGRLLSHHHHLQTEHNQVGLELLACSVPVAWE